MSTNADLKLAIQNLDEALNELGEIEKHDTRFVVSAVMRSRSIIQRLQKDAAVDALAVHQRQVRANQLALLHTTITGIEFNSDDELQLIHLRDADNGPLTLRFDGCGDQINITLEIGQGKFHIGTL